MHGVGGETGPGDAVASGAVVNALGFPAALVDARKKVLHANRPFREFLGTPAGGRLWRRLEICPARDGSTRFVLDAGSGLAGPRIIGLRPLAGCNQKAYLVTVSVADPGGPETLSLPTLGGDITATEQAVLFGMLAGRSLSEIAQIRGSKTSTVRWHLKNLQAKLGVTDKAEVIAWIARSPVCWLAHDGSDRSDA